MTDPADADEMNEQAELQEPGELADPWHDHLVEAQETYGSPEVLAVVALVLAVASFCAFGLMNGTTYVVPLFRAASDDDGTRLVVATLLGAALALVPVWLGWRASSRLLPGDPAWVATLARTAILLGLASGAMRLVVAVVTASQDGPTGFTRL